MASNRDTPDTPIATWQLPTQGVQQQIAAHQLPLDAFYDALNVCLRSGKVILQLDDNRWSERDQRRNFLVLDNFRVRPMMS